MLMPPNLPIQYSDLRPRFLCKTFIHRFCTNNILTVRPHLSHTLHWEWQMNQRSKTERWRTNLFIWVRNEAPSSTQAMHSPMYLMMKDGWSEFQETVNETHWAMAEWTTKSGGACLTNGFLFPTNNTAISPHQGIWGKSRFKLGLGPRRVSK